MCLWSLRGDDCVVGLTVVFELHMVWVRSDAGSYRFATVVGDPIPPTNVLSFIEVERSFSARAKDQIIGFPATIHIRRMDVVAET